MYRFLNFYGGIKQRLLRCVDACISSWLSDLHHKRFLFALCAGGVGYALNYFDPPVFGDTTLIFGGVFSLIVAATLGPIFGGFTAAIVFLQPLFVGQQSVVYGCFFLESVVVGLVVRRFRFRVLQATLLYWVLLGWPVILLYLDPGHQIPFPLIWVLIFKYPLNGILAAMLAAPVVNSRPLRRWLDLPMLHDADTPLRQVLFRRFGIIIALPLILLALLVGQRFDQTLLNDAKANLREDSQEVTRRVEQ